MNVLERAIIYATEKHQGVYRKGRKVPYILHPLEVAQIISTMTDDIEIMTAGILHDVVEDTDGTIEEIEEKFGVRVAQLVATETENKYSDRPKEETWQQRKEESLVVLRNTNDIGVKMLWLGDKLANIRSLATGYTEKGEEVWQLFHMHDPEKHLWYYKSVAEALELDLNRTGAYKEFIQHINFIWPGTFTTDKERYKKFKEYSIDGCKIIGKGAKGTVYRYNDEIILKVYNEKNTFKDIERETYLARSAFVAGIPTAISFGIVTVGERYASVFELLDSSSISNLIAKDQSRVKYYAKIMADLGREFHSTPAGKIDLPDYKDEMFNWIDTGIIHEDVEIAEKIRKLITDLPASETMIHGDFHTGNIMMQGNDPFIIDMDTLARSHPIAELAGVYMFYRAFGDMDPSFIENFMGFTYETSKEYYDEFMKQYLGTEDEARIKEVTDKAALLCYTRLMRRVYKQGLELSEENAKARDHYLSRIRELIKTVDTLEF